MTRRYRAPAADRAVLVDPPFDALPDLIRQNRRSLDRTDVTIGGLSLQDFRRQARAELLGDTSDAPLLVTGHQPELFHPGVWVKNFALNGLARRVGGIPLHLIADHDTMKSASVLLPTWDEWTPEAVRLEKVAFDEFDAEEPWETRAVRRPEQWAEFVRRVNEAGKQWGYEPLLAGCSALVSDSWLNGETWATIFTRLRTHIERAWGCDNREITVSRLSQSESFRRFVRHIAADAGHFRTAYNSAVQWYRDRNGIRSRSHPVPDLGERELPFWVSDGSRRRAAMANDVDAPLRPRALTLTLFARLGLGDLFVHGIGGGKYDEVTDALVRDYFGLEPPAYQVLSATLHLPLPHFRSSAEEVQRLHRQRRGLEWNPERFLDPREATELKRQKAELLASRPAGRSEKREWYRRVRQTTQEMQPFVDDWAREADRALAKGRSEVEANGVLRRRDFAWVLYPEDRLGPFLRQFL